MAVLAHYDITSLCLISLLRVQVLDVSWNSGNRQATDMQAFYEFYHLYQGVG